MHTLCTCAHAHDAPTNTVERAGSRARTALDGAMARVLTECHRGGKLHALSFPEFLPLSLSLSFALFHASAFATRPVYDLVRALSGAVFFFYIPCGHRQVAPNSARAALRAEYS